MITRKPNTSESESESVGAGVTNQQPVPSEYLRVCPPARAGGGPLPVARHRDGVPAEWCPAVPRLPGLGSACCQDQGTDGAAARAVQRPCQ